MPHPVRADEQEHGGQVQTQTDGHRCLHFTANFFPTADDGRTQEELVAMSQVKQVCDETVVCVEPGRFGHLGNRNRQFLDTSCCVDCERHCFY